MHQTTVSFSCFSTTDVFCKNRKPKFPQIVQDDHSQLKKPNTFPTRWEGLYGQSNIICSLGNVLPHTITISKNKM